MSRTRPFHLLASAVLCLIVVPAIAIVPAAPAAAQDSLPTPPTYDKIQLPPTIPDGFCSEDERSDFIMELIYPEYFKAIDNESRAQRFLRDIEEIMRRGVDSQQIRDVHLRATNDYNVHGAVPRFIVNLVGDVSSKPIVDCAPGGRVGATGAGPGKIPADADADGPTLNRRLERRLDAARRAHADAASRCHKSDMEAARARLRKLRQEIRAMLAAARGGVGKASAKEVQPLADKAERLFNEVMQEKPRNCPEPAAERQDGIGQDGQREKTPAPQPPPPPPGGGSGQKDFRRSDLPPGGYLIDETPERRQMRYGAIEKLRTGEANASGTNVSPGFPVQRDPSLEVRRDVEDRVREGERHHRRDGHRDDRDEPIRDELPPPQEDSAPQGIAGIWRLTNTASGVSVVTIGSNLVLTGMGPAIQLQRDGNAYYGEGAVLFGQGGHSIRLTDRGNGVIDVYAENGSGGTFSTTMSRG